MFRSRVVAGKMRAVRYVVTFLIGAVMGAFALFLYLQGAGKLAIARSEARAPAAGPIARAPVGVPLVPPQRDIEAPDPGAATRPLPVVHAEAPLPPGAIAIPVAGVRREELRDHFDDARWGHAHHAIDIMAPRGTPVLAAIDGTIRKLFLSRAGGITIYQTDDSKQWIYYYAHLESYAPLLAEGATVRRGDVIGFVGTTGNAPPDAPHLHFAVGKLPPGGEWWKSDAVNPYPILMERGVTWAGG
jgi:murein DD-endopeptidase MepM/ murein hydrolase activator NlpD